LGVKGALGRLGRVIFRVPQMWIVYIGATP
jgi:hypothetical protein